MTLLVVATVVAVAALAAVTLFQLALAAGVPWGRAAYGGVGDPLPLRLRVVSAVAAVFWGLVALTVAARGGVAAPTPVPDAQLSLAVWIASGLLVPAVVLNLITPSRIERAVWFPVSAVALVTTAAVNVLAGP